ncbi:MAG: alkaline phosphatase family protein [bacterium]
MNSQTEIINFCTIIDLIKMNFLPGFKIKQEPELISIFNKAYRNFNVILIDGLGWNLFQKSGLSNYLPEKNILRKALSQFPTTTAAHITSIRSGLPVSEHGVYEWNIYDPFYDDMITPLQMSLAGENDYDSLIAKGISPQLFPKENLSDLLKKSNLNSNVFLPRNYAGSYYSRTMASPAKVIPYKTSSEALIQLRELNKQSGKKYNYLYFDQIDALSHKYGPNSEFVAVELNDLFSLLAEILFNHKQADTLYLVCADHGLTSINPEKAIYLNQIYPEIIQFLKKNQAGKPLVPAGSPRDQFLHIEEKYLDQVIKTLKEKLSKVADIIPINEEFYPKYFKTNTPSQKLLERIGNVLILPKKHNTVWWYERGKFEVTFNGHHGGLSDDEKFTPLIII